VGERERGIQFSGANIENEIKWLRVAIGNDVAMMTNSLLAWHRFEFELPAQKKGVWVPWHLHLEAEGNGFIYVNGRCLGRYWQAGPQHDFFLPDPWLNFGSGKTNIVAISLRPMDMHHDAGFLYTLYAVALYKLTVKRKYREIGLAAAEALYQRFNPHGGFIRAWGRIDESISPIGTGLQTDNMAIIDSLMNLPLLYWASLETGDRKYHDAAVRHADTTLKSFIRSDDSVYHAYRFDLKTGQPLGGENFCGRAVESHWSRGASWAIYGFALSYRYTGDKKYLAASLRVACKFNELMNGDAIPVWDFGLPSGEAPLRDTSAAAVVACACQELEKLGAADLLISKMKKSLLANLCTEQYLDFDENCPGVLREAQVGFNGAGSAQNAYTSWGDYFLMEALDRELHGVEPWW
jgi:unsaturated chondroitin disaccharide hydrolase